MNKDEALDLALEALEMADELEEGYGVDFKKYGLKVDKDIRAKYEKALAAIKQALAAPVQEPVGEVVVESMGVRGSDAMRVRMHFYKEIPPVGSKIYTTPPAAPDLKAELDATNRQVEILSDALAESRREIDALVAIVRADEREACAMVCMIEIGGMGDGYDCAAAIRARGETK